MDLTQANSIGNQSPINMNYSGAPMGTGVGDIVLNGSEKPKKRWWIIGGIVGVILIVIVVTAWVFVISPNNQFASVEGIKKTWNEYYNYLMFGPGREGFEDVSVDNWYPIEINNADPGDLEYTVFYENYYRDLRANYDSFYDGFPGEKEDKAKYGSLLQAFIDYNMMDSLKEAVAKEYSETGLEGAKSYINSINPDSLDKKSFAGYMYGYMAKYLNGYLLIIDYYDSNGCNYNEAQTMNCPSIDSSNELSNKIDSSMHARNNMDYYYDEVFAPRLFIETSIIDDEIGALQ